jgi:hypothetical protein
MAVRLFALSLLVCIASFLMPAIGQAYSPASASNAPALLTCSPAPCVLPAMQASPGPYSTRDAAIAADPSNPLNVIVGTDDADCNSEHGATQASLFSSDGGSDWTQYCMPGVFKDGQDYLPGGFPILGGFDSNGVAYIGGAYIDTLGAGSAEGFQKSRDGVHWTAPAPAIISSQYGTDYCWMAVDASVSSPYVNSVYLSCQAFWHVGSKFYNQVVVAHSRDGGSTWQQVNVTPPQTGGASDTSTAVTVGSDGTVYLTWQYCYYSLSGCGISPPAYMLFCKSSDGGNTWTKPTLIAKVTLHEVPNTDVGVPNTPAIAVDNSDGLYAGSLYVAMYNWTGSFMQVVVVHSTDGGNTWSQPVPVAPGITHDQFLPWVAVSPLGLVGVSWLDRRNDPADVNFQAFAGISSDGGLSFQPNVQLTNEFSNPDEGIGPWSYFDGCTWDGPNYFLAAWMQLNTGSDTQVNVGGIRLK